MIRTTFSRASLAFALAAMVTVFAQAQNLVSVTLESDGVVGGVTVRGNVKLDAPAGAGGVIVQLTSSNSVKAAVPATVTVKEGTRNRAFNVLTQTCLINTDILISATLGGPTVTANLFLAPGGLTDMAVDQDLCSGEVGTGQVWLSAEPANDTSVSLRSSNPAVASVPDFVTVLTGSRFSEFFDITAGIVVVDSTATIRSRLGNALRYDTLTVHPDDPSLVITVLTSGGGARNNAEVVVTYSDLSTETITTGNDGLATFVNVIPGAATYTVDPPGVTGPFGPFAITISGCEPTLVTFQEP